MSDYFDTSALGETGRYAYWIVDTLGGEIRANPPLSAVSFSKVLNGTGTLEARIPARHPDAEKAVPVLRSIYVTRGLSCLWGGILWAANQEPGSAEVQLTAAEFGSFLGAKRLKVDLSFAGVDKTEIADALVEHAQNSHGEADLGIVPASSSSGVIADRNYLGADRPIYLELVQNLANTRDGFRFDFPVVLTDAGFERRFVARAPLGRRIPLRIDERLFAASPGLSEDGTSFARRFDALGEGEADSRPVAYAVDTRLRSWPMLDAQEQFSSVSELGTLEDYARERLARSSTLRSVPRIPLTTRPGAELGTYGPGDEVYLELDLGWRRFAGWQRIAEMKVYPTGSTERIEVAFVDPANFEVE